MIEFWPQILLFTVLQGLLSALLSVLTGWALARLLWLTPQGRLVKVVQQMGDVVFVMPGIFPAMAYFLLFPQHLGLGAIVLVHVFLNMPYVAGRVLKAYTLMVTPQHRAQQYLMRWHLWQSLWYQERPLLQSVVRDCFLMVLALCLSSFSIILILGGGPETTTLSVALYSALTYDFDQSQAIFYCGLQLLVVWPISYFLYAQVPYPKTISSKQRASFPLIENTCRAQEVILFVVIFFYLLPLGVLLDSLHMLPVGDIDLWMRLGTSILATVVVGVAVALLSGVIAVSFLGWKLSKSPATSLTKYYFQGMALWVAIPKIVLVAAILMVLQILHLQLAPDVLFFGLLCLCYLPFFLKSLGGEVKALQSRFASLIALNRFGVFSIFRHILWPLLRGQILHSSALVACFSMGNLSVALLLGYDRLPLLGLEAYHALLQHRHDDGALYMLALVALMGVVLRLGKKKEILC